MQQYELRTNGVLVRISPSVLELCRYGRLLVQDHPGVCAEVMSCKGTKPYTHVSFTQGTVPRWQRVRMEKLWRGDLDDMCAMFMANKPFLSVMPFDDWFTAHTRELTGAERLAALALLDVHPDFRREDESGAA